MEKQPDTIGTPGEHGTERASSATVHVTHTAQGFTPRSSSPQWEDGRRNGVKACIEWLHAEAATMNDPHARMVLNNAAFGLGVQKERLKAAQ